MQDGKAIKMLATASRLDIEDFLQKKVYLEVYIHLVHLYYVVAVDLPSPAGMQPSWRSFYLLLTSNA
jgi:GTP-binding protein Era